MKTAADNKDTEDFCLNIGKDIGLCRKKIEGEKQQDFIAYEEEHNSKFQNLSLDYKVGLLERVVKDMHDQNKRYQHSGATLQVCFNSHDLETNIFRVQLANLGDAHGYLVILNDDHSIFECSLLNVLHKPHPKKNIKECRRVQRVADVVMEDTFRLKAPAGCLAGPIISRAIGNSAAEPSGLSHQADIYEVTRLLHLGQSAMTITASTGLEKLSIDEMKMIIRVWASNKQTPRDLANQLASAAYQKGSNNNISLGVILSQGSALISSGYGQDGEQIAKNIVTTFYPQLAEHSPVQSTSGFSWPYYPGLFSTLPSEDDITYFLKVALTWMLQTWLYQNKVKVGDVEKWLDDPQKKEAFTQLVFSNPSFFVMAENKDNLQEDRICEMPISFFIKNSCFNFTTSVFVDALAVWKKKNKQREPSHLIKIAISFFLELFRQDLDEITRNALLLNDMLARLKQSIVAPQKSQDMWSQFKRMLTTAQACYIPPEEMLLRRVVEYSQWNYLDLPLECISFAVDDRIEALHKLLEQCKERKYKKYERDQLDSLKLRLSSEDHQTRFKNTDLDAFRQEKQTEFDDGFIVIFKQKVIS